MSDKLNALLQSGDSPVIGPNSVGALEAFLAAQPALDMPTEERIDTMIARLAMATKERRQSVAESRERLALYWRTLRELPLVDLMRAFDDLLRTCTFMPTPAEVYAAANSYRRQREFKASRARHLIAKHNREWAPPLADEDRASPEDIAAIKASLAEHFPTNRDTQETHHAD